MYYRARHAALGNGDQFHVAAYTKKKCAPIGLNSELRNTARFWKRYPNSDRFYHEIHAEVDLILKMDDVPHTIHVVRFMKDGRPTMSRPCIHCQNFLRIKGVRRVRYTNWSGVWEYLYL